MAEIHGMDEHFHDPTKHDVKPEDEGDDQAASVLPGDPPAEDEDGDES